MKSCSKLSGDGGILLAGTGVFWAAGDRHRYCLQGIWRKRTESISRAEDEWKGGRMEEFLRVGVISSTHGVRGEVKVYPTTDDPRRYEDLEKVLLDTGKEHTELAIEKVRFFKNQVILKFKDHNSIEAVERYKGMDLLISREDAVPLGENENYIADLIGMNAVTDQGETLGVLKDVLQTGANDVYVIETLQKEEILLPAIRDCILDVDVEEQKMLVHVLEGLLD